MKEGVIHFIADSEHFEAHMALERAQAITDLIAKAGTGTFDDSKSNAAFAVSDLLYDVAKLLEMDGADGRTAPVLELVNAIMAASDDATKAHGRALDAVAALKGKRPRTEVAAALKAIGEAEQANQAAYAAAIQIGYGLFDPKDTTVNLKAARPMSARVASRNAA